MRGRIGDSDEVTGGRGIGVLRKIKEKEGGRRRGLYKHTRRSWAGESREGNDERE